MKKIYIKEDTSIDWYKDYHVCALNLQTKEFDKANDFCADDNVVINIDEDYLANPMTDEWDTTTIREKLDEFDYLSNTVLIFILYSPDNRLVGYIEEFDDFGL